MKKVLYLIVAAVALTAGSATAQSGAELAKAKGCLNCHEMDKKKVGPSFKDLTAKHKDTKDRSAIVAKLKDGKGHPKTAASDAELKALVDYSLSAK